MGCVHAQDHPEQAGHCHRDGQQDQLQLPKADAEQPFDLRGWSRCRGHGSGPLQHLIVTAVANPYARNDPLILT